MRGIDKCTKEIRFRPAHCGMADSNDTLQERCIRWEEEHFDSWPVRSLSKMTVAHFDACVHGFVVHA